MLGGIGFSAVAAPPFPAGTILACFNATAPTGWTKGNTHDNKAVRLTTGTPGSGGSVGFTTVFGRTATDATTLTDSSVPSHTHGTTGGQVMSTASGQNNRRVDGTGSISFPGLTTAGLNGSHTHPMDIRVLYVDMIQIIKS